MTETTSPSVAVMGAGAVGCYYGGVLAAAGVPVTLIGRARHVTAIRRDGLAIVRADRRDVVRVCATTDAAAAADANVVLLCVKSTDTEVTAAALASSLRADAVVVTLQNGVDNADRVARAIDQVVLAAVVWVGAFMEGDGVVRHTGRGDLVVGVTRECATRPNAPLRAAEVSAMFEHAGVACPVADDIEAALWRKLVINCAFNAVSALGRSNYGRMSGEPLIRDLMETAVAEAVAVAQASGIALDAGEMRDAVWSTARALSTQHSSMAQDVLRGRRTEIDSLNGYVAQRARALGVDAPVNSALHALVKLREARDDSA